MSAPFFSTGYYSLERDVRVICNQMTENGFRVDVPGAQALTAELEQR
jgi:hypothetical protein